MYGGTYHTRQKNTTQHNINSVPSAVTHWTNRASSTRPTRPRRMTTVLASLSEIVATSSTWIVSNGGSRLGRSVLYVTRNGTLQRSNASRGTVNSASNVVVYLSSSFTGTMMIWSTILSWCRRANGKERVVFYDTTDSSVRCLYLRNFLCISCDWPLVSARSYVLPTFSMFMWNREYRLVHTGMGIHDERTKVFITF